MTDQFRLNQTNGPRITATSFNSRIVTVTFDIPVAPSTVTPDNIYLVRAGDPNSPSYFTNNTVTVSRLPGATLSYNAAHHTLMTRAHR